ncbi:MAG TPA: histidine kinase [Thermoanaerobaculia bacterium]|nr:histidine kinase [Thermoanaerobaculia bacterium]
MRSLTFDAAVTHGSPVSHRNPAELVAFASTLIAGAIVAFLLYRFVRRMSWPRPFRLRFGVVNVAAALATGVLWLLLSMVIESLVTGSSMRDSHTAGDEPELLLLLGLFLYGGIAGIIYPVEATARAARAESLAARTQLAALRAQIHPHFVFNALHAVVQLIPVDPERAAEAAELVASLLRTSVEENRDEVPLDDEWNFVSRYLEVEHIRFGDRLRVHAEVDPDLLDERVPSFALQTLVENAVRHGAAHRVAPTEIVVTATGTDAELTLSVRNTGDAPPRPAADNATGTGLSRLRERLALLYGDAARLTCGARHDGGYESILVVPRGRRTT